MATKAIKVKTNQDHSEVDSEAEVRKSGFYVLLTGPKVGPITRSFKTGRHGKGEGRITRGALWAIRQIGVDKVLSYYEEKPTPPLAVTREGALKEVWARGFRKAEVLEHLSGKGARKTGVRFELKDLLSGKGE